MLFQTLKSLSLAKRLTAGFATVLLLLVAVAITGAYSMRVLGQKVQTIVQVNNAKTEVANDLLTSIDSLAIQTRSVALFANLETDLDGKQAALEVSLAKVAEEKYLATEKKLAALLALPQSSDAERALFADITAAAKVALPEVREAVQQGSDRDTVAAVLTLTTPSRPSIRTSLHPSMTWWLVMAWPDLLTIKAVPDICLLSVPRGDTLLGLSGADLSSRKRICPIFQLAEMSWASAFSEEDSWAS